MRLIQAVNKPVDILFIISSFFNLILVFFVILGILASALKSNVVFYFPFDFPFFGDRLTVGGLIDLQSIVFSSIFLFSGAYSVINNTNVRVDVLYKNFSTRAKLIINIIGTFFLSIPFVFSIFIYSIDFVKRSYIQKEVSLNGGISSFYIFKMSIPVSFFVLLFAIFVCLLLNLISLFKNFKKGGECGF